MGLLEGSMKRRGAGQPMPQNKILIVQIPDPLMRCLLCGKTVDNPSTHLVWLQGRTTDNCPGAWWEYQICNNCVAKWCTVQDPVMTKAYHKKVTAAILDRKKQIAAVKLN